jgi:parallel beta-helix repeat protein
VKPLTSVGNLTMRAAVAPFMKRFSLRLNLVLLLAALVPLVAYAQAPTAGQNINMVSGTADPLKIHSLADWTIGDPFLQRQDEPSLAVSTRNASHLLAGANDYRTVDLNFLATGETGDAWLGVFKSFDGGQTWRSTLLPGYPLDSSLAGLLSPIHGFQAASDPMVRAGSNGLLYYSGIAFNRGPRGLSEVFLARFIDRNNKENGDPTNEVGSMTNVVPRDPVQYTGTFPVAFGSDDQFVDKPSLAVDIPRTSTTCTIFVPENGRLVTETIPAGKIYIAYTVLNTPDGDKDDDREPSVPTSIMFKSSSNCGYTWHGPVNLSGTNQKNQGSVIAIDPNTGTIYVAWRRFYTNGQPDAILIRKSTDGGNSFSPAVAAVTFLPPTAKLSCAPPPTGDPTQPGCPFDQFSTPTDAAFRTSDYPALAVDGNGRVYLAWTQRQQTSDPQTSDARIMIRVSDGTNWSSPAKPIDNGPLNDDYGVPLLTISGRGHQLMPSLSFNAGTLTLAYYDLREDHTMGKFNPRLDPACDPTTQFPCTLGAQYNESRDAVAELLTNPLSFVFNSYITDLPTSQGGTLSTRRHTMEVTAAQASPNVSPYDLSVPTFTPFRVSKYAFGVFPEVGINDVEQLQFNPPNLPLFVHGTTAFDGDYIEAAGAPTMVFDNTRNSWKFNTAGTNPVFHVVWADNRDVRPPLDGNWQNYVPPYSASNPQGTTNQSKIDPTKTVPACTVGSNVGMRNQNIYTAQVTQGLVVSSLQSSKPLLNNGQPGIQRAFAVTAKNATNAARSFQWTVRVIPATPAVVASFDQFVPTVTTRPLVHIPAFSSVSLPVFVQAKGTLTTNVTVEVDVSENVASNPLQGSVVLNSDPSNPTLLNPDNAVFGNGTITTAEYYNPLLGTATTGNNVSNNTTLLNPGQGNPGQGNPGQGNPGQGNNGYTNPNFIAALGNPGQGNPGQGNTVLLNPGQGNNGIANPGQGNPGQGNTAVVDANLPITNQGNTGATYIVKLFPTGPLPPGITVQVMLSKLYATTRGGTAAEGTACQLVTELNTVPIASIIDPTLSTVNDLLNPGQGNPGQGNPGQGNATLALAPGESGQLTYRIAGPKGTATPPSQDVVNQVLASFVPVVVSQAVNTVDAQAGSTQPPFSTPGSTPGRSSIFITNTLPGGANPLPDGMTGTAYNAALQAVGGTGKYSWSITSGTLPSNLTLNSTTGLISGTPVCDCSFPATFPFTVQVRDSASNTATRNLVIRLAAPLTITTASPLTAAQGVSPSLSFAATGGIGPYGWSLVNGEGMPIRSVDGLTLSPTGVLTGVPAAIGVFNFRVQVTDSGSPRQSTSSPMTLNVRSPLAFLFFATQPSTTTPGSTIIPSVRVQAEDSSENPLLVAGINITLAIRNNPSNGTLSGTTTQMTDGTGIATFNDLSINLGGNGYTLLASSGAISVTSSSFNVVFLVTNTGDSGPGSLRQAILDVNAQPGSQPVGIVFNMGPGKLPKVLIIAPQTDLPILTHPAILDATTQPIIELNGSAGIAVNGLHISAGNSTVRGFVINRFSGDGILLDTNGGDLILGNYVGTDASGTVAEPNGGNGIHIIATPNNVVGGADPSTRNVISGNSGEGLRIDGTLATGNVVQGNYIGTNAAGSAAVGNILSGIYIRRAPGNSVIGNIVSGNQGFAGITICGNTTSCGGGDIPGIDETSNASGNAVQGNLVGTDATGTAALRNSQAGVSIDGAPNTQVGGTTANTRNTISFSGTNGVQIFSTGADGNKILGNTIASNNVGISVAAGTGNTLSQNSISGHTGLGIDLAPAGVNLNTSGGAHNFPVITSAPLANGTTTINGTLNSTPNAAFTVEFFSNASCNASGYGDGTTFLGSTNVGTDVSGNASFSFPAVAPATQSVITTTATDPGGTTSEFSACMPFPAATTVNLTPASAGGTMDGQSFNETRAADVKVLAAGPLTVSSMTLSRLNIGGSATSATVGARIYDSSSQALVASGDVTVNPGSQLTVTIPIAATLASGATYRVGFYVQTTPSSGGSGTVFLATSFPYTEATGRFQIVAAWDSSPAGDAFPATTNTALPQMTITVAP